MISFLHPWVLAGLLAAGIPILLHLIARRQPPTIVFPAVRYLLTTTQEHQKRLKLQNWLLLLLRTLLIIAIVLAAAGPTVRLSGVPGHAPSALVVILDNSASSAAVTDGTPRLAQLRNAARAALARATAEDALWLITADGVPRRGDAATLAAIVDSVQPSPVRLDVGAAVALAGEVLASEPRPGEVLVLSDLQASGLTAAEIRPPVIAARVPGDPPPNAGIVSLATGPQPWSSEGGRIVIALGGDSGISVPVSARLGGRPARQVLGTPGAAATVNLPGAPAGWWNASAELDADEFRLDDRRETVVRIAPVARADCSGSGRHVEAACDVLAGNGRIGRGSEVTIGRPGPGASVVLPPADAAELGALNRSLERLGSSWRYGELRAEPVTSDSSAFLGAHRVVRRYTLVSSGSGRTGVLASAGGSPWIVRSGQLVLIGSRLEPDWTSLPVSAEFMPFMDRLLNRVARGEVALVEGTPGEPAPLPDLASEIRHADRTWRVDGGGLFRAVEPGVHYILAGRDTIGALSVGIDARESRLAPAADRQLRELWPGARVVPLAEAAAATFSSGARGDLRGPLIVAAILLGLAEVFLASWWRRGA